MKHEPGTGITTLNPWGKGMNNRAAVRNLPDETVRNAVNVNFGPEDQIVCRSGMEKVLSAINPQGGFSCPMGQYFVEGFCLKQFNADNTATTLYAGVLGSTYAFDYENDVVYFSDGVINLKITDSGITNWGMTIPPTPLVYATAGAYGEGKYLAAYCWVDSAGVESGCSPLAAIDALDNSGFVFSNLPSIADPQVSTLRIYLSTANGQVLYHVADTTASTYTISAGRYDGGNVCESLFIYPPPPGRIIRHYNGRMCIADSYKNVWFSESFSPDRFRLGSNYLIFPESVDVMEPVTEGIFFVYGDRTDFYGIRMGVNPLDGVEDGFHISRKFDYGGVYGTGRPVPNTETVCWQSQRGTIIGTPEGECKNIQENNVAVDSAVSGALLLREKDGIRQIIASLKQPTTPSLAATSWIDAEIVRRGA